MTSPVRYLFLVCCFGAASTGTAEEPLPPEPYTVGTDLYFKAQGGFLPTVDQARESALEEAQHLLGYHLRARGIQRFVLPSIEWIDQYLVLERNQIPEVGVFNGQTLHRLTLQVRITSSQMRSFRKMERISLSAIVLGLFGVTFLASWLYYRLDEWSKGYLTSWLATGLILAAILVGGLWWWLNS
jgi:hypothetical protein